jgi:hypothetical protein
MVEEEEEDPADKKDMQEGKDPRQTAKSQPSYWITQGERLARMAQRFSYVIFPLFPERLTDKE